MEIRSIIIEDEKSNRENLATLLCQYCPEVELVDTCGSAIEGRQSILRHNPDLIFLDIEMPGDDGFSLLNSLADINFEVIFVTAHDQYALKAIKICALDYLLKPIDILELTVAVEKAKSAISQKAKNQRIKTLIQNNTNKNNKRIALPLSEKIELVEISKIIRCQAEGNYTKIYIQEQPSLLVSRTIKEYDEILVDQGFIRVHQSHLINSLVIKSLIKKDGGYLKLLDGTSIPISRQRKDLVMSFLKKL